MTNRFRMVAGPNGSGKTTLTDWLAHDYAGFALHCAATALPQWFLKYVYNPSQKEEAA